MKCVLWYVCYWILHSAFCWLICWMLLFEVQYKFIACRKPQRSLIFFCCLMRKTHNRAIPTIIGKTDCNLSYTNSVLWENQVNNCHEFKFLRRCVHPQDLFVLSVIVWEKRKSRPRRTGAGLGEKIFLSTPTPSARDGLTKNKICKVWVVGNVNLYGIRSTPFGGTRASMLIRRVRKIVKCDS